MFVPLHVLHDGKFANCFRTTVCNQSFCHPKDIMFDYNSNIDIFTDLLSS